MRPEKGQHHIRFACQLVMPAASTRKSEEREFVVNKKNLNSAFVSHRAGSRNQGAHGE